MGCVLIAVAAKLESSFPLIGPERETTKTFKDLALSKKMFPKTKNRLCPINFKDY